jgi:hypothetical protein
MISHHSLLEAKLANCLYRLARVDFKIGRVVIGNPRGGDILDRMQELAQILGLNLSPFPWTKYRVTLEDLKSRRDIFAHSVWMINPDTKQYMVIVTKGSWPKMPFKQKVSKKIYPEPRYVTASDLRLLRSAIEKAIREVETLDRFVSISLQVLDYALRRKST